MASKLGGLGTFVLAGATALCGLFVLSGVSPAPSGAEVPLAPVVAMADTEGGSNEETTEQTTEETSEQTTDGAVTEPTTPDTVDAGEPTTESTAPTNPPSTSEPDTATSTTSSTTTTTSSTTTTTTAAPVPLSPVPLSVISSNAIVGAGGVVTFSGTCAVDDDGPRGPLMVWVVGETTDIVETGVASAEWTYEWTAPVDEAEFGSFSFQFWCGDPAGTDVGYPTALQHRVDMVASAAPAPTTPLVESDPEPISIIPETD